MRLKVRADVALVERGQAATREKARALIMAGLILGGGRRIEKPGELVPVDLELTVLKPLPYASRGGLKLAEALDIFDIDVRGRVCADVGSSTGGFTDCLLQRGAVLVYAIDVDIRQLDRRLRQDPRVVAIEKNARFIVPDDFPDLPEIIAMDVSFISVLKILPALRRAARDSPFVVALLKPQFEVGREKVGRKGIVRDPALHRDVLARIVREAEVLGFSLRGLAACSTRGRKGNREFFAWWAFQGLSPSPETVIQWIEEVIRDEENEDGRHRH
jgi:23S rRNA (cytidine1920-2'-O)/16S rRNA (cytidine1409-2'-O)-methyltransferase